METRSQQPLPHAGSQLVAPASSPGAQDAGQALQGFRLSSQVPREVAERIAQFMRTGSLNRDPFSFAPLNHVLEAEPALTPEQEADLAVASLIAEAAPHMRLSESVVMERENGDGGLFATAQIHDEAAIDHVSAQAAIRAQAALQPPTLVPTGQAAQPAPSTVYRGDANPLFESAGRDPFDALGEDENSLIDLIAGPREIRARSRIT
jgi:hypothetical protein